MFIVANKNQSIDLFKYLEGSDLFKGIYDQTYPYSQKKILLTPLWLTVESLLTPITRQM